MLANFRKMYLSNLLLPTKSKLFIFLLGVFIVACGKNDEEVQRIAPVALSPEDVIGNMCILSDINNQDFFEPYQNGVKLKFSNANYLIPMAATYEIGVSVTEVISNRIIKVKGDFTTYKNGRFENFFTRDGNESVYFPYAGYNSDYDKYITPLSGVQGTWPYFDGENTWLYVENKDHQILKDDYLNFFIPPSNEFSEVYLPQVTPEMTLSQDTLVVQILLSSGENLQVKRNEEGGLGRLQSLQSSKTDEANIALSSGSGKTLFSLTMVPREFSNLDGYTNFGWGVVAENINYYEGCLYGYGVGSFPSARKFNELRMLVYEAGKYSPQELSNGFINFYEEFTLDRSYNFIVSLPAGNYEFMAFQKDRRGRFDIVGEKENIIIKPMKVTDLIIDEIR